MNKTAEEKGGKGDGEKGSLLTWLEPAALWVLRRSGYWRRVNTLEGAARHCAHATMPASVAELNLRLWVAYESGRHELVWKLQNPEKGKHYDNEESRTVVRPVAGLAGQ